MFDVAIAPTYTHKVIGTLPGGVPFEFEARFKRVSPAQVDEITRRGKAGEVTDAQVLGEVMVGWSGVSNAGAEVPFDATGRELVFGIFGVAAAAVACWYQSLSGAREKN